MSPLSIISRGVRRAFPWVCLILIAATPAYAKKKKHGGGGNSGPAPTPPFSMDPGDTPSTALSKFMSYFLDNILAPLSQPEKMPRTELGLMETAFTTQAAQGPAAARSEYQWAAATCNAMSGAMDERDKAVTAMNSSQAPVVTDITDPRGKGAKRVSNGQNGQARATEAFLASGSTNAWDQRATVLRGNIQAYYARVVAAEHPAASPAAPAPAGVPAAPTTPAAPAAQ